MSTALKLPHIGEQLLCALLTDLAKRATLGALSCVRHDDCTVESITTSAGIGSLHSFVPNAKLRPAQIEGDTYLFDGAHEVDVLCVSSTGQALPLEAKLGVDRLSASEFSKRFLKPPEFSRHSSPRVTGSMVAILDRDPMSRLGAIRLYAAVDDAPQLSPSWGLVVRAGTWKRWRNAGEPPLRASAHVFVLETLVSAYGGPSDFDALVARIIGGGFFEAWELGPDAGDTYQPSPRQERRSSPSGRRVKKTRDRRK